MIALFVAANMYFYYLVAKDSPSSRSLVPWALLVASIASFLIALWIIYYICCMYPENKVSVVKYSRHDDDDFDDEGDRKKKYTKQSKGNYILNHALSPIINGLAYLLFFFVTLDWVRRHENQERAYG